MSDHKVNTKATPGPFDPLDRTADDEPIFILVARDPLAAPLVEEWADQARHAARKIEDEDGRRAALLKCGEAEEVAWQMRAFVKGEAALAGQRASMSEAAVTARDDHEERAKHIAAGAALREAAAQIKVAEELLTEIGVMDKLDQTEFTMLLEATNGMAEQVELKRGGS